MTEIHRGSDPVPHRRGSVCCGVLRITDLRGGHLDEDFGIALSVADPGVFEERGAQENSGEARRDRGFRARALWRIVGWFYMQ